MMQALLVIICLAVFPYQGNSAKEFWRANHYEVVYPRKLHALHKRDVGEAEKPEQKTKYEDAMQYEIKVNGKKAVLHLEKNKGLFSKDYSETHYSHDGREITTSPQIEDHCYYDGHIQNDTGSTASISACHGLKGYFKSDGEKYLIEPLKLSDSEAHAVFKYESLEKEDETPKICGVTNTTWESDDVIQKTSRISTSAEKQEYLKAKKYVELYIAVDNKMFRKYGYNMIHIKTRVFQMVNHLNVLSKVLNIHVALIGLEIWSDEDKIVVNSSAGITLDRFSEWRQSVLLKRKRNDNAQLLTDIDFTGPTVGLAYVGTMCSSSHSVGVVQDHDSNPLSVGATMAHEMGHNFGMNHDKSSCTCRSSPCIMSDTISYKTPQHFSSCSLQDYEKYIMDQTPQCIINRPLSKEIVATPVCGNDFVEEGEECDCGSPKDCKNECCEAATCKLKPGAKCGHGQCCENCQLRRAGAVCRAAKHDCDLPELCTGQFPQCPMDRFRMNGHPCQNNMGYCYMGKCPTLANQCTTLWGPGAKVAADSCFAINRKGVYYGHCQKANGRYIPCKRKDLKCGKLYCTGGSRMPSAGSLVSFDTCKGSFPRYKNEKDAGMVGPGTKCGEGMVCSNGQCVEIEMAYRSTNCSNKCKGHSVCDHELQCQCEEGWAPPHCDDPTANRYINIIVVVVIVVLVVTAIILAVLFHCSILKRKQSQSTHKTAAGATNPAFSGPDQKRKQHLGPVSGHSEMNLSRFLLPPPSSQANKPPVCVPIVKPNIPPPPVPTAKSAIPPAMALKPPGNLRV